MAWRRDRFKPSPGGFDYPAHPTSTRSPDPPPLPNLPPPSPSPANTLVRYQRFVATASEGIAGGAMMACIATAMLPEVGRLSLSLSLSLSLCSSHTGYEHPALPPL